MIDFNFELDASGLNCPLPLLRLKKSLAELQSGEVIKMIATDPAAHLDVGVYIEQAGHQLLESSRQAEVLIFYIRKS